MEPGSKSKGEVAAPPPVAATSREDAATTTERSLEKRLAEALAQQTAISEILRVISSSPGDVKPMLNAVAERALKLCDAADATIFLLEGDKLRSAARFGSALTPLQEGALMPLTRGSATGRAVVDRAVIHIEDLATASEEEFPVARELQRRQGNHAFLSVPLMRDDRAIGAISLWRMEARRFTDKQIALVKTFADQAAIAIENVRLFNETKEALEQQTATSEILRVISQSPMSVQPVFDTIVGATLRLCSGRSANLFTFDGQLLHLAAHARPTGGRNDAVAVDSLAMQRNFPRPPGRDLAAPRAVLTCSVVSIPDVLADAEYTFKEAALAGGFRSVLAVPLIREGSPIGAIVVGRPEPGPFPETQIALLKTFADQAVIAIENVRLFNETKEALEQQRASGEVLAAISNSIADTSPVFEMILTSCERLFAGKMAVIDLVGEDGLVHLGAYHGPRLDEVKRVYPHTIDTTSATGTAIATRGVVHFAHIDDVPETARRAFEVFGIKAAIGAPMLWEGKGIGAIWVARDYAGPFSEKDITLLKTFADQAVIAIQNARLIREIEEKSRELEAASRHKSEFLANMSHELRTPLNAIIGFSEVLSERMFGEVNDKQAEYLRDILESGQHLLSLINDILDLSKIEAGRMELEPTDFDLPSAIGNTLTLVRERAHRRSITLERTVDERLGMIHADERKVKQVLLNLLSNALKFTPEGGRIDVRAAMRDGTAEISVADTGVGIAPEDQEAVFEEFRQVGTASKEVEGTGLGLAISRKFIELHGGRIWATSEVGIGSTFTFTLPLQ